MRDSDSLVRVPGAGLSAGQPSVEELLHQFEEEREILFRKETYRVRNNGAVFRLARTTGRRRPFDGQWTFGKLNKSSGYLVISEHVIHQIVATAFHGERPSNGHVVDHIDTNRNNNRAENLRWVTRLENILLNPITCKRIVQAYGSFEAFFENPGIRSVQDMDWMRTVSKEEAQESLERLRKWAEKETVPKGGALGEWIYGTRQMTQPKEPESIDTKSDTPGAFQRRWRTPMTFPHCPAPETPDALEQYEEALTFGAVFGENEYGKSIVVTAKLGEKELSVLAHLDHWFKEWAVAKVYLEDGRFCHEPIGMFVSLQGALKAHCEITGESLTESIDDYC